MPGHLAVPAHARVAVTFGARKSGEPPRVGTSSRFRFRNSVPPRYTVPIHAALRRVGASPVPPSTSIM